MAMHNWQRALLLLLLGLAGCTGVIAAQNSDEEGGNSPAPAATPLSKAGAEAALPQGETLQVALLSSPPECSIPATWYPYQAQPGDSAESLAARFSIDLLSLLHYNCLSSPTQIVPGRLLYVPSYVVQPAGRSILPLGISAFDVQPAVVAAGGRVTLSWALQGPVQQVRLGWVYQNQFIELATNLQGLDRWELTIPDDGREHMTLMLRVGDGQQEVAAQTNVQVQCEQAFFFTPAPPGCPTAPLLGPFVQQHFERGTIVYMPTLGLLYLLPVGGAAQQVADTFVPGMPLRDLNLSAPAGRSLPSGAIYYAWRQGDFYQQLGYAIGEPMQYTGMMQRSVDPSGETLYLLASNGQVYQLRPGRGWGVLQAVAG